jgi:hypothetical protein
MKTKVLLIGISALLLMWICISCSQEKKPAGKETVSTQSEMADNEPEVGLKLYGIKSGIIEYKHSGAKTGTSILYFDRYGHRTASYSDLMMNGQPDKGWIISFDEMQYMYREGNKQGTKLKNPMIEALNKVQDIDKLTEDLYDKMGFKPAGTENFLGKDCRVFKGTMGKVMTWNGLLMYMEMNAGTMTMKQEATKVEVNVKVKSSVFDLPGNVTFTEMPGFGKGSI